MIDRGHLLQDMFDLLGDFAGSCHRRAVWQLRRASGGGSDLSNSYDEARTVIDQGARLDRYLRLRTSSTSVDQDLSELRSNLQVIAEAYGMNTRY